MTPDDAVIAPVRDPLYVRAERVVQEAAELRAELVRILECARITRRESVRLRALSNDPLHLPDL